MTIYVSNALYTTGAPFVQQPWMQVVACAAATLTLAGWTGKRMNIPFCLQFGWCSTFAGEHLFCCMRT